MLFEIFTLSVDEGSDGAIRFNSIKGKPPQLILMVAWHTTRSTNDGAKLMWICEGELGHLGGLSFETDGWF